MGEEEGSNKGRGKITLKSIDLCLAKAPNKEIKTLEQLRS
jgi:hypothetical protein